MPVTLHLDDLPPGKCRSYTQRVHAEITRAPRRADPREAGRSKHEMFLITRTPDHLSPRLYAWCSDGTKVGQVTIRVTRPDDDGPLPFFAFELRDVLVTSIVTSLEDDGPLETITFDYGGVVWTFEGDDPPVHTAHDVFPPETA